MAAILISNSDGNPLPQSGTFNRPLPKGNQLFNLFKRPGPQSVEPHRQFETGNRLFDLFFLPEIIFFNALSRLFGRGNNRNDPPRPQQFHSRPKQ